MYYYIMQDYYEKIKLFKKITTAVMTQMLLVFSTPAVAVGQSALAETSEVQLNNIVLFAQSDSL
ncbi:MAG: hypothetical protein K2K16_11525 [Ruminococcus sp.]|nr:hypothetical protein [Ruminococcus sp.]